MYSKSSTALAIISVLSILIVLFIALSNVEESPVRKPFPSAGADATELQADIETVGAFDQDTSPETSPPPATDQNLTADSTPAKEPAATSVSQPQKDDNPLSLANLLPSSQPGTDSTNAGSSASAASKTDTSKIDPAQTELLNKNVSNELLDKVGYRDFVIKPRPFDGMLFGLFDLNMLSFLDIVDKKVIQNIDGNEKEVLRVYEFNFSDSSSTNEIYDFLRAKIKDELGVSINETNQFGLASFYINFQQPKEQAFLVVKTRTNVYALSYPKAKDGDLTYFELTSQLLSELI